MNGAAAPTIAALGLELALAVLVFQANPKRRVNQSFFILSIIIGAWLASLYFAFGATTTRAAEFAIRQASATGILYLTALNLLRLSVRHNEGSWLSLLSRSRGWLLGSGMVVALCQTPWFLIGVHMPSGSGALAPNPVYGPGIYLYACYFCFAFVTLVIVSWRDLQRTSGTQRAELGFIITGGIAALAITLILSFVLEPYIEASHLLWFAPFRVVIFSFIVAYGISTRKVMEVSSFLRRALAYLVLTAYLLLLYSLVWWLISTCLASLLTGFNQSVAHVIAALVVTFAMTPARGVSQTLANRLFVGTRGLDFRATMNQAAAILKSVTTLQDLLGRFAKTIGEAVGTDRVIILLPAKNSYEQSYPPLSSGDGSSSISLQNEDPTVSYLQNHQEPIVFDELYRVRQTPELELLITQMKALKIAAAVGIFSRDQLVGVMLLGPRLSGRIYGSVEQNALLVLCGQLAVAIENAELFTAVQNAKIYNETLLANLTTGVVAAGADGRVTVFNKEAEQITGYRADSVIDQPLDSLPPSLREILNVTLFSGKTQELGEVVLSRESGIATVRASSSIFHDQAGQMLGALMVVTDVTALKRLEQQIRRSDRLASLGTLSAGMAHEIKNPLVSIKTFAQLLPERYQDSDFRETFSSLIGHEIDRIDSLVNQLLRFARPAKPLLRSMHVHEVLEKSLQLVGHRLYQSGIKLARLWGANVDTIRADADQLEQVFLNFFLNAMDAMKKGGELTVATEIIRADEWVAAIGGMHGGKEVNEVFRITIRDNGEGIRSEDIPHVFDPFFTTKDYGTGLGLSVVHGIIQEHGGQIEVESEIARGTAFHILLPLVRFEEEAVAA